MTALRIWRRTSSPLETVGSKTRSPQGPQDPWEKASMPAKVARRISERVFHEVPPERIPLLTNAVHWAYGTGWRAIYGLIQGPFGGRSLRQGVFFGAGV
jgi:hypothetical protein